MTSGVSLHLPPGSLLLFAAVSQCLASWPSFFFVSLTSFKPVPGRCLVTRVRTEGTGAEECCYKVIFTSCLLAVCFSCWPSVQVRLIFKFLSFSLII